MKVYLFYQRDLSKIWITDEQPRLHSENDCWTIRQGQNFTGWESNEKIYCFLAKKFKNPNPKELVELEL